MKGVREVRVKGVREGGMGMRMWQREELLPNTGNTATIVVHELVWLAVQTGVCSLSLAITVTHVHTDTHAHTHTHTHILSS